ncbi:hypothetical protein BBJ28_00003182 [Nothophytophthora sp. Chile5]|nr:hypothetical protein BBJ28_00003182 [Nothophytophthora sp. Chile5]
MLAEVVRRRSSWSSSLAAARRLTRPLQVQVQVEVRKSDAEEEASKGDKAPRTEIEARRYPLHETAGDGGNAVSSHLRPAPVDWRPHAQHLPNAQSNIGPEQQEQATETSVALAEPTEAGADASSRARESMAKLAQELEDPRATVWGESAFQRTRRQLKAATPKLDRMLDAMRQRGAFAEVEAVAFLWEEAFPQFAGQPKHWSVICEHYAMALNRQKRFEEVVDKFFPPIQDGDETQQTQAAELLSVLSPRLAESLFVALGHLRNASQTLQLLDVMERQGVCVTKVAYFHVLNALLHDESFTDFEKVLELCEEIVCRLPGETVPLSLLPMIIMTAAARGEGARAMAFYCHPPDATMSTFTEFRLEICLQQLGALGEHGMLMEMYRNLMASHKASQGLKERVSKYLLRKSVTNASAETRNKRLRMASELLEIMEQHNIAASHHSIFPLMRALLLEPLPASGDGAAKAKKQEDVVMPVRSAADLRELFARYSHVLQWNPFALCEAIVAGIRIERADLVDGLIVYALDRGMPIKYAALEQVVVFYCKLGLVEDLERVADMVRALRLNKHIPLGIAVTEIGMTSNFRLGRYEEVVVLFEDFATRDGERKRVLKRRIMLKSALNAYTNLGRVDDANAIRTLLRQHYGNLLTGSTLEEEDDGEFEEEGEALDEGESEDSDSHRLRELQQPPLHRFNR